MSGPLRSLLALKRQAQIFGAPSVRSFAAETLPQFKSSVVRDPATGLLAPQWHFGSFDTEGRPATPTGVMHFGSKKASYDREHNVPFEMALRDIELNLLAENGGVRGPGFEYEVDRRLRSMVNGPDGLGRYRKYASQIPHKRGAYLLDIQNPMRISDQGGNRAAWRDATETAREEGHDGLVYKNEVEDRDTDSWVPIAEDRPQVKSLRARTLDMGDADVYKAGGGLVRGLKSLRKGLAAADPEVLTPAARLKDADAQLRRLPEVIKKPGGNWLTGSVERVTAPLKVAPNVIADNRNLIANPPTWRSDEAQQTLIRETDAQEALNRWIDKKLVGYIKNDMATERDPIRALAERGVTHAEMRDVNPLWITEHRQRWEDAAQLGRSPEAVRWEDVSDMAVRRRLLGDLRLDLGALADAPTMPDGSANPVAPFARLPDETEVHSLSPVATVTHGFDHIIDVLREQLTTGALTPQQLEKVNIANAVERAHAYNLEREAAKKAALAANLESMTPYKAYDEGWRWVQLDKPGQFAAESDAMGHSVRGYEPPRGHKDWTKESGNSGSPYYGLGGWDAITSGRAKIYSLKDSNGKTYATVEAEAPNTSDFMVMKSGEEPEELRDAFHAWWPSRSSNSGVPRHKEFAAYVEQNHPELFERYKDLIVQSQQLSIRQIKGPSNRAPDKAALPYLQDFVRSGKWSEVRDLSNTKLRKLNNKYWDDDELRALYFEAKDAVPSAFTEGPGWTPVRGPEAVNWDYYDRIGNSKTHDPAENDEFDNFILKRLGFEVPQ